MVKLDDGEDQEQHEQAYERPVQNLLGEDGRELSRSDEEELLESLEQLPDLPGVDLHLLLRLLLLLAAGGSLLGPLTGQVGGRGEGTEVGRVEVDVG